MAFKVRPGRERRNVFRVFPPIIEEKSFYSRDFLKKQEGITKRNDDKKSENKKHFEMGFIAEHVYAKNVKSTYIRTNRFSVRRSPKSGKSCPLSRGMQFPVWSVAKQMPIVLLLACQISNLLATK